MKLFRWLVPVGIFGKDKMVVIEEDYYEKEMKVKLTGADIETIIDCLNRTEYGIFMFFRCNKIIKKLKKAK